MTGHPKLRSDLVSSRTSSGESIVYTMKDPITGTYFRLREPEYWLVNQLDGASSPEEIAGRFREKFNLNIGAEDVQQFVDAIEKLFFLDDGRAEQQISRSAYRPPDKKGMLGRLLYIKLKAFNPGRFLDKLTSIYSHFHNRFWLVIAVAVVIVGVSLLAANLSQFRPGIRQLLNIGSILAIVVGIFSIVMFHEFAHAIICRYHGGEVREIGFLLMYFQPCFYADLSDAWLFEKKSHRLAVTWAGPICQLILLSLAVIVWRVTVPGTFISTVARIVATVGWFTLLINLNPLLKLDGYYLLSDWLEIPNLRRKAFAYLGNVLKRRLLGWPIEKVSVTGRERRIYLIYSVLAALFSFGLLAYILFLVGQFLTEEFGGFGLILLLAFVLLIIKDGLTALVRGTIQHVKYMKNLLKNPVRLGVYGALLVAVILFVFVVPFPHRVSGEVSVEPLADYSLKLDDNGLLETRLRRGGDEPVNRASLIQLTTTDMAVLDILPMVEDGQKVKTNDTLAILTSSQVTHDIAAAQAELERLQGQLDLLKAPPKQEQVDEASAEVEAAQANLDRLKRERERSEELAKKNLIAEEQLEAIRSNEQIAVAELANKESALRLLKSPPRPEEEEVIRHEIDKQKARIAFLKRQAEAQVIVAPFAGVISSKEHDKDILSLEQNDHVELLVPVSDFEIPLVKVGQTVMVKVRSFPHLTFFGSVVRIPQSTNSETGRFPVSVVLENKGGILQQGMTGYAKIEVGHASLVTLAYRKLLSNLRVEFWSWW